MLVHRLISVERFQQKMLLFDCPLFLLLATCQQTGGVTDEIFTRKLAHKAVLHRKPGSLVLCNMSVSMA